MDPILMLRMLRMLRVMAACCALLAVSSPAWGVVATDVIANNNGVNPKNDLTATDTSIAVTITVGSGSNRAAVALIFMDTAANKLVTGVSGLGGTWTQLGPFNGGSVGNEDVWCLANPTAGSGTVTVTHQASKADLAVYTFTGVNQTTPCANFQGVGFLASPVTVNVTTANGDYALSTAWSNGADNTVSGCTSTVDSTMSLDNNAHNASCAASGATTTFTWTAAGSFEDTIGVRIQAAAAAATPRLRLLLGVGQ